tara:strand:- start:340 stop:588 length:249 start_codon:yes stop_codon:yes gene_type:complete
METTSGNTIQNRILNNRLKDKTKKTSKVKSITMGFYTSEDLKDIENIVGNMNPTLRQFIVTTQTIFLFIFITYIAISLFNYS